VRAAKPGCIEVAFNGSRGRIPLDAQFSVPAKGITAIVGQPGCGKKTVARCIAGFTRLPAGFCALDGEVWQDEARFRPPHLRPVAYVAQRPILFSQLSVRRNLLYAAAKSTPTKVDCNEVVELLGLASLLDRSASTLSGGERQRVAIGSALLSKPRLLVVEDLLAAQNREILPFLERLHENPTLPMIYLSHHTADIEHFADHLVMMEHGIVTAAGPLQALQSDPALPLASRRDAAVSLDAVVSGYDGRYGLIILRLKGARLLVPGTPLAPGTRRRLRIAACDVSVAREAPRASSILNIIPARINASIPFDAAEVTLVLALEIGGSAAQILARIPRRSFDGLGLSDGMDVFAEVARFLPVAAFDPSPRAVAAATRANEQQ